MIVIKDERTDIPESVFSFARELIMDGGATDPASRPSFAAIVDVWRIGNSK
jgi:hypothetical protein